MKKIAALCLAAALAVAVAPSARAEHKPGGFCGGVVGCCFGIRSAAAWNEGKAIDIREWLRIIPIVGIVGGVWNAIDGWNGVTTDELRAKAGATYY